MSSTLPRPGSVVQTRQSPPPRNIPTATDLWMVTGTSDKGPLKPVDVMSLQDFINNFGARQTYSVLYDAAELFFREGGSRMKISRTVGPAAVSALVTLAGSTGNSLVVTAKGPGAYGNTLRVTVVGGGTTVPYTITISDTVLGTLEVSPSLADQNAAVAWSATSAWVDITLSSGSTNPAAVSNAALITGTDDRLNIVDANWLTALNRFNKDLGPAQVSAPGRTTLVGQQQLRDHATANNRFALIDLPDTPTVSTLTAATIALRSATTQADRYGAAFAPWLIIPGIVPGTTRFVPPSAAVAARIAAGESKGGSPNKPAAGYPDGALSFVMGLSQNPFDDGTGQDVTRDTMYAAGVNQICSRYGTFEIFGWRTLTDPFGVNQDWINAGNARLNMAITAKAVAISENYILDEIDGDGRLFKQFQGDLTGMLMEFYQKGSLYGSTPEAAFQVNVDNTVNTPTTIANRELHAVITVRMSPMAELVFIEIVKVPTTQTLALA